MKQCKPASFPGLTLLGPALVTPASWLLSALVNLSAFSRALLVEKDLRTRSLLAILLGSHSEHLFILSWQLPATFSCL